MSEQLSAAELLRSLLDGETPEHLNLSDEQVTALAREAASSLREVEPPSIRST